MSRLVRWAGLFALLVALAAAAAGWLAWRTLNAPYRGYEGGEKRFEIRRGEHAGTIVRRLELEGLVASARLARAYLVLHLDDPPLKAGEYRFREPLSTPQVLARLIRGKVLTHPVTLIEGLTLEETALALSEAGFGDRGTLEELMRSPRLIADLDPEALDLEGYLFPDTYHFARGTSESEIVGTLVRTFRRRHRDEILPLLAAAGEEGPADLRSTVILASVVEKEARLDEERPLIAGVFANRLRRGMPLQADPTVIYALLRLGRWNGNLRRPDLQVDSPFNTYRYPGLPPGPICSPGLASLEAAARPAETPDLYFVSRNDGSHVFAATLAEHNRNVQRWQKDYWRKRWAEERRRK